MVSTVPDKIFYIGYKENAKLSIDDESCKYNEFINDFYLKKRSCEKKEFKIIEYDINNRTGALKFAEQNAIENIIK